MKITFSKWPPTMKVFLSACCCCKNEKDIGFLTLTLSWDTSTAFQLKPSNFLVTKPHFMLM